MAKLNKSHLFLTATATAVAVSSAVPSVDAASTKFFTDVKKGNALYPEILDLHTQGKINGFADGTFRPHNFVTRAEAAKMVAEILELDMKSTKDLGMKDIKKEKWYYGAVAALVEHKVMGGFADGTFRPDQTLTRAEASRLIGEAFKLKSDNTKTVSFKDVKKGKWYYTYVQALVQNKVTLGKTKDMFAPDAEVTRGELVAFAARAKKAVDKGKGEEEKFTIEAIKDGSVTIDGKAYEVASSLKGLFSTTNEAALKGAMIAFESKDGVIDNVTSLVLNSKGTSSANVVLDASDAVIDGSVVVEGDYYELKNLTINGDLTLTEKVQNSFISEKLTVKGTTTVAEQQSAKTASYRTAAENPKTKITIVFKDSTIATIEIAKDDVYFSATGSTKVTSISLQANTNIFADPDVIIPKVDIKKGVTLVELNVTVKDVIIESNDDIKVTGKGNVENVVINTDKTVTLDTTGQIKNLESKNENSKVTIGENAKIVNVTVPEGKKAEDIVQNFEQVKDNIEKVGGNKNPDYQPSDSGTSPSTGGSGSGGGSSRPSTGGGSTNPNEETGDFFAAGILEGSKFGYVKLNPKNRGNYKVKYVLVDRNSSKEPYLLESGATVPSDAIEYQENSEFILWANHEIFVYLVDENNKVIDTVDVNEEWYWGEIDFDVNKEAKELTIKTNINRGNQSVAQMFESIYLFNADKATKITDFSNIDWKEIDGLPAVTLNYGDDFDPSQFNRVIVHLSNYGLMTTIHDVLEGSHDSEQEEAVDIYALEYLVKENNRNDFSWVLDNIAREKVESPDGDGSIEYRYLTENDSVSTKKYFEVISQKLNEISNSEDVKKVVLDINEELKEEVDSYKEARASVDRLFKEDRHDYGEDEQLKEGLKQEEIDAARVLVQAVSNEFTEKEILGWEIYYAEYLLNKPLVEDFIEELKKEIEITNPVIGLSISDLLYKEKPQKLQIKVNGLGNEVKEEADYSYVSGDIQYLSVDASGKLILNRLNTSGESVTEYASIQLEIGDNYYDEKIVAVTIPSSETDETASSVTAIELKENPSYIRYISNYAVNKKVSLKPGISVGQLIEAIQAEDGSTQTYKVTNADGEEKTSGLIEHGDRLIVTAANGQSKDIYNLEIPIVIQNLKAAEFGKLTFEAENTSLDELKTLIGLYQENPYSESSDRADFTLNEAKDENKNTKPNHYEINIYNAAKDVAYQISIARNKGKQVEFQSSNPDQLAWRSFQVIDTDANPDTEATITDFGSLTLDLDTVKVQLKDSRNYEEEWAETVTIDGVAISSEVKEEGGEWKIHFKSEGTDKGEVDDYRYLRVTVTAAGIPNRESINLEVSPEGSITVRRW